MDDSDFEGSLVLERLAETGGVDAFLRAVDADDFDRARALMESAGLDDETIAVVLRKMQDQGAPGGE